MPYRTLKQAMKAAGHPVSEGVSLTAQDMAASRDFFYFSGKKMEDFVDLMGRPVNLTEQSSFEPEEGDEDEVENAEAPQAPEVPQVTAEEAAALEAAAKAAEAQAEEVKQPEPAAEGETQSQE